jgi:hypothetical protein
MLLKHNIDGATVRTGKWTEDEDSKLKISVQNRWLGSELPRWFRSHKKTVR